MIRRFAVAALLAIGFILCVVASSTAQPAAAPSPPIRADRTGDAPPPAPREFRGARVATVSNIDWPSKPGLPADQQKRELIAILDRALALHLNAIIVQVRSSCDALYESKLEPWSGNLTGVQGQSPGYDPLAMWIDEAHRRGIEFHAWMNPYRVQGGVTNSPRAANHISRTHPEVVRTYGKMLWLDPGEPFAAAHTRRVFLDIAQRYDVDGLHIDDYFYPYFVRGPDKKIVDFPDAITFDRYQRAGGKLSRNDWRRDNVSQLIEHIYTDLKKQRKTVKFGIAPFGIWKSGVPAGIRGMNQYDELYADPKLWLNKGWLDYFSPQLYWAIGAKEQSFPVLLRWWIGENVQKRNIWPGINTSHAGTGKESWPPSEITSQIALARYTPGASGVIHWSMRKLMRDSALIPALQNGPYAEPALVPASPWLDDVPPAMPRISTRRDPSFDSIVIRARSNDTWQFAVFARYGRVWKFLVYPGALNELNLPPDPALGQISSVVVTAVDRCGNESARVTATMPR